MPVSSTKTSQTASIPCFLGGPPWICMYTQVVDICCCEVQDSWNLAITSIQFKQFSAFISLRAWAFSFCVTCRAAKHGPVHSSYIHSASLFFPIVWLPRVPIYLQRNAVPHARLFPYLWRKFPAISTWPLVLGLALKSGNQQSQNQCRI